MTAIACVAIVCAAALVGLRMFLAHERPQVSRAEFDVVKGDLIVVEKKLIAWGEKVLHVEKVAKLNSAPEPVVRRSEIGAGPRTRDERLGKNA